MFIEELSFLLQPLKYIISALIVAVCASVMTGCSGAITIGNEALALRNEAAVDAQTHRTSVTLAEHRLFQPLHLARDSKKKVAK